MKLNDSAPVQLLATIWANTKGGSYQRLNYSLYRGLMLAIEAGFRFEIDDFSTISARFRGGYWFGADHGESFYTTACERREISAARAFERYANRKPWILSGHRLAIGYTLMWDGARATITTVENHRLIACTYKRREPDEYRQKIERRHIITRQDFNAVRKSAKSKERKVPVWTP